MGKATNLLHLAYGTMPWDPHRTNFPLPFLHSAGYCKYSLPVTYFFVTFSSYNYFFYVLIAVRPGAFC